MQWDNIFQASHIVQEHTAVDPRYELSVQPSATNPVHIISVTDGWAVVKADGNIGLVPVKCLAATPPLPTLPAAPLPTHTVDYASSSTSAENTSDSDDEGTVWQSPDSKQTLQDKNPPPLPTHPSTLQTQNNTTPPPAIPHRSFCESSSPSLHQRKFTEQINRRQSLEGMATKYKRMSLPLTTNTQQQQQQQQQQPLDHSTALAVELISPRRATKNALQVFNVCTEIIETQRSYCNDLDVMVHNYLIPLRQQINLGHMGISIPDGNTQLGIVFNNIESLQATNGVLLSKLLEYEDRIRQQKEKEEEEEEEEEKKNAALTLSTSGTTGPPTTETSTLTSTPTPTPTPAPISLVRCVATAFEHVLQRHYSSYSIYCVGYTSSIKCLQTFRTLNPMIDRFITKCSIDQQRLSNLLIKPVQRICKYPLFFRDLLKCVPSHHVDYLHLQKVTKLVEQMSMEVNDKVKSTDQSNAVIVTSFRLQGTAPHLVQPHRRLILEDDTVAMQQDHKFKISVKKYTLFLFNDLLLFARPNKNHHISLSNSSGKSGKGGKGKHKQHLHHKFQWLMKNISIKGETSAFDPRHGWPFYVMKRVNVNTDDDDDGVGKNSRASGGGKGGGGNRSSSESCTSSSSLSHHLTYGTAVERIKLYAATEERRKDIVQRIEECRIEGV